VAIVWSSNFSGNSTSPVVRQFRLRLDVTGTTPGTLTYRLEMNPLSNNLASSYGPGRYSLSIGGTTIATNAAFNFDFRGNTQTTLVIRSGTISTSAGSVFTSGSASGNTGTTIGSASGSGTYSLAPPPPFFPFFPPFFPFFPFFPPSFPFFPPAAVWSTTSFTETARVGTAYSKTLTATGIRASDPYELVGGTTVIPAGLTLNRNTGVIAGTPTAGASQTFNFTVNAYNEGGAATVSPTFTLNRRQPLPTWLDETLGRPRVGTAYNDQVVANNAAATNAYSVVGLPANGLSLNANTGAITGTPVNTSSFSFTITAKNSDNDTIQKSFTLTPNALLAAWSDQILTTTTVRVNQPYTDGVAANNAVSYALQTPDTLPPGLALNTGTGAITGTPTTVGTYNFRVVASNASTPAETITTGQLTILVEPSAGGSVWDGSEWVPSVFKVWNGSAWIESPVKIWNGSTWADPAS
jgi:hypothetical protein